jgi:hypothetical protein
MPKIIIPSGKIIMRPQPFLREPMDNILRQLCDQKRNYTGFISIEAGDDLYLLFFFCSRPYAAGKSVGDKPISLSIRDFFLEAGNLAGSNATITIHATDPVQLKCMLIYCEDYPTVKAPTSLINLPSILQQIHQDSSDAMIILEKQQKFNLFFFKHKTRGMSYYADSEFTVDTSLPTDKQLLAYAAQPSTTINAQVYRSIDTREDMDSSELTHEEMLQLLEGKLTDVEASGYRVVHEEDFVLDNLILSVLEGSQKGQTLSGPLPCVLGRKDCDIVVADSLVSKKHATLQVVNGKLVLKDLNSTNGTMVNNKRIMQQIIVLGDIISMGGTAMKVVNISPPPP